MAAEECAEFLAPMHRAAVERVDVGRRQADLNRLGQGLATSLDRAARADRAPPLAALRGWACVAHGTATGTQRQLCVKMPFAQ